jgi:hypothetical protein
MAQLCARAMYATRPSFHFDSAISGSDGGAAAPPSSTPGVDRVMGNDGTVLFRTGYEARHAVVTVGVRRSLKLEDLRGAGPRPSGRSPSGVSRRTTFRDAVRERRRTEAATVPIDRGRERTLEKELQEASGRACDFRRNGFRHRITFSAGIVTKRRTAEEEPTCSLGPLCLWGKN